MTACPAFGAAASAASDPSPFAIARMVSAEQRVRFDGLVRQSCQRAELAPHDQVTGDCRRSSVLCSNDRSESNRSGDPFRWSVVTFVVTFMHPRRSNPSAPCDAEVVAKRYGVSDAAFLRVLTTAFLMVRRVVAFESLPRRPRKHRRPHRSSQHLVTRPRRRNSAISRTAPGVLF